MNAPTPPHAWRPPPHGERERPRLGDLLLRRAGVGAAALASALADQRASRARIGDLLRARGASTDAAVCRAVAEQRGLGHVDLERDPPDPALLDSSAAPEYLARGILPWRRRGRVTTWAVVDPDRAHRALAGLGGRSDLACCVVTTRASLEAAVARAFPERLAARAATRTPARHSVRGIGGLRRNAMMLLTVLLAAVASGGAVGLAVGLGALFLFNAATMALRVGALVAGRNRPDGPQPAAPGSLRLAVFRPLPRISIMVPLHREANMVPSLVAALDRLDYPRERLEVRLLLEANDHATRLAVERHPLPAWITPLVVPRGRPRTKPRALNYALDFCRGEIVGILDVEDHPEPGQLRAVAATLLDSPPEVACVQCQLSFFNMRENWMSRCFQIEYSVWFDVLLRGWQGLGLPVPLGGTSVYFRRSVLEAVGGWDAHNVTEDADLGMRLARAGFSCAILRSTTWEEANCRLAPWIRQRSRWLKGYILTWLSHMRDPRRLHADLGTRGFLGLNMLFLGAAVTYLAMPLFWAGIASWAATGTMVWHRDLPAWFVWPALTSLGLGQLVMLACAGLAATRRRQPGLVWWVPTLPLYWTIGALAAWKAVLELLVAPFWWDKTDHGITRLPPSHAPDTRPPHGG